MYNQDNMRAVSDILDLAGPVAFDQVDKKRYQPICPWCGQNIGEPITSLTYGELYMELHEVIAPHVMGTTCAEATAMVVKVITQTN